jgi:hypothetical protein
MFWALRLLQLRTLSAAISPRSHAAVRYEDEHATWESYPGAVGGT